MESTTHNPPGTLAISDLLRISPLEEELVCCVKLRGEAPFAEPQRAVTYGGVILDSLKIYA